MTINDIQYKNKFKTNYSNRMKQLFMTMLAALFLASCTSTENQQSTSGATSTAPMHGQSGIQDEVSNPNIVQTAVASPDHSTLVAAVQAAGLVDALSNAGPFTVFAPTNAAFDLLPAGTVDNLLKPANKNDLSNILEYHTYVGKLPENFLRNGEEFEQVNAQKISITREGDKIIVNGDAVILATINTANGIIHVIDKVLLPPAK